jgi:hypothetical protein
MAQYSKDTYQKMFDILLSEELCYAASAASENNIKRSMKFILGRSIKTGLLKSYSNLVLNETLDVHFTITDASGDTFELVLYYGK